MENDIINIYLDDSKLIAKYIGWSEYRGLNSKWNGSFDTNNQLNINVPFTVMRYELKFHSSWDWLIPVINKITSSDQYPHYVNDTISMVDKGGIYINTTYIHVTFENVIHYIEWYNKNYNTNN